ncbi:MAG TPA: metalloregulator ArsR/SmtB family transcription factor [Candidatus Limnocylindrales bacterium]|nr:metalloregulator ArsR/SmtB family transcription factor [Candidatus Limnocylindrales bacterium]
MARSTDPDLQLLAALADPTRMEIVRELAGSPEVCACDFTSCCDVSQPTVSHHLRVLRDAGVVTSERRGNWVWYRLAPNVADRLGAIAGQLLPDAAASPSTLVGRTRTGTAADPIQLSPRAS